MKYTKRIISVLLCAILVLMFALPAFVSAADAESSSSGAADEVIYIDYIIEETLVPEDLAAEYLGLEELPPANTRHFGDVLPAALPARETVGCLLDKIFGCIGNSPTTLRITANVIFLIKIGLTTLGRALSYSALVEILSEFMPDNVRYGLLGGAILLAIAENATDAINELLSDYREIHPEAFELQEA